MRWQLKRILYFGTAGRRREIPFELDQVNIITGPSGTGKSAVLNTIDYCLGASRCRLPHFVRMRAVGAAVEWRRGSDSFLVARGIPVDGHRGALDFYYRTGSDAQEENLSWEALGEPIAGDEVRAMYAMAFGIGDALQEHSEQQPTRITVRNVTPFIFLSKEVVDSDVQLFFGFDDPRRRESHERSMAYFLGAVHEEAVYAAIRMRQLRRQIRAIERKRDLDTEEAQDKLQVGLAILAQAAGAGIPTGVREQPKTLTNLVEIITRVAEWTADAASEPDRGRLADLEHRRLGILGEIRVVEDRKDRAIRESRRADAYLDSLAMQKEKLSLVRFFNNSNRDSCPVCAQRVPEVTTELAMLRSSLEKVSDDLANGTRAAPQLTAITRRLDDQLGDLRRHLRQIDSEYDALSAEAEQATGRLGALQAASKIAGRASMFLETLGRASASERLDNELESIKTELDSLEERFGADIEAHAHRAMSHFLSRRINAVFSRLPRRAPCLDAELYFDTSTLSLAVVAADGTDVPLPSVGSDQNYLAIHLSLALGIQDVLGLRKRPVPALLVIDQISRPYFPSQKSVVRLNGRALDEDTRALREHFEVLFQSVAEAGGLQAIVLEHADFDDFPDYAAAVRHRWDVGQGGTRLIPDEWPTR